MSPARRAKPESGSSARFGFRHRAAIKWWGREAPPLFLLVLMSDNCYLSDMLLEQLSPSKTGFKMTNEEFISNAIASARQWLAMCDSESLRMDRDFEQALAEFSDWIDEDDLESAYNVCLRIARVWASGDTSGFSALRDVVGALGCEIEPDDHLGYIVEITRKFVTVAWDGGIKTTESVERLSDWGFDLQRGA